MFVKFALIKHKYALKKSAMNPYGPRALSFCKHLNYIGKFLYVSGASSIFWATIEKSHET